MGMFAEICPVILGNINEFVNSKRTGMYCYVKLSWNALDSKLGPKWLDEMRDSMKKQEALTGFKLYLTGTPTTLLDQTSKMRELLPFIICGCLGVSFVVLAIAFKSILIPLRSMITIIWTQIFVFGLAVLVFQYGILDWLCFPALSSNLGGVEFHMPIAVFSIVVGLCLDYDIFLLTRTMEETETHQNTQQGIQFGVVNTGSIITTAGIIMAFAFGGLLGSHMGTVNQLGFFLVAAALYDTFVSRSIITPALMSILGDKNWWPGPLYYVLREVQLKKDIASVIHITSGP